MSDQPHDLRLNTYVAPRKTTKQTDDIEDIILDGVARARPDTIKYLCPFRRRLLPGETYRWCQCGKSEDIFCDDTCITEPTLRGPLEFTVEKDVKNHALCGCRYTASPPFCDGWHSSPRDGIDEWIQAHPEDADKISCLFNDKPQCGDDNEKSEIKTD